MARNLLMLGTLCTQLLLCSVPKVHAETIGYWRFEEGTGPTALDSSGYGNNGNLLNGPTFSSDVVSAAVPLTGEPNRYSLSFDGSNDVVVAPDSGSLHPARSITIEVGVKPAQGARVIIGKQLFSGCCVNSFQLELNPFRFQLTDTSGRDHLIQGPFDPTPGAWHHIAGTWDGATMRLYLDGNEVASGPFTGPIGYDGNPVLIGAEDDGLGIPGCCLFRGLIDEVRISDQALNPSEFLSADRCNERFELCVEDLAQCQGSLQDAQDGLEICSAELSDALATIADLQGQLLEAEEENARLREVLSQLEGQLVMIEDDLRQTFNDPAFTIPGGTTLERYSNLVSAILTLPRGAKLSLYRDLGGQAAPRGRP